jgi:hypothetical protein
MSQKNQLKKEIIDAACHLRSTNQTIPSSTIELMKTAALEKVEYIPAYEKGKFYYISKNGWFYRPNSAGYTERRTDAGVYSEKEAKEHAKRCAELTLIEIDKEKHNRDILKQIQDLKLRLI